jgi:hypothetical protein
MKKYSDDDNTRTDVNGAWKPLKPLQEGYEFVGDDQYDNFLTKKGKERRDLRQQGRASGLSRKDARKSAINKIPTSKPARKSAYLELVKINYRGFAWKLNAIITGSDQKLLSQLKEKWRKFGAWQELVDAVNKGKDKKPFFCGGKCRLEILDAQKSNFVIAGVTITASTLVALASTIITALASIITQGQIGKQQREAIASEEKLAQQDFDNLTPEQKDAIKKAENQLKKDIDSSENQRYIWIGVGIVALIGLFYIVTKKK